MRAIVVNAYPQADSRLLDDACLPGGEVLIKVQYSALNYKDMLAITGRGKIMRHYPLIAGIDGAGVVEKTSNAQYPYQSGDSVLVVGAGLGEDMSGALAEYIAIDAQSVIAIPKHWNSKSAMLLGTAGFSAALAVNQLLKHGIVPEDGEIAVTGANGAVGLWAVRLLAYLGYDVVAVVRDTQAHEALFYQLGAQRVLSLAAFTSNPKALDKTQYAAGIDNLGGMALAALLSKTQTQGAVCAIGMAQAVDFQASVMPFILRGISLYGINSSHCSSTQREQIWAWLGNLLDSDFIAQMPYQELFLDEVIAYCQQWDSRPVGRVIVNLGTYSGN